MYIKLEIVNDIPVFRIKVNKGEEYTLPFFDKEGYTVKSHANILKFIRKNNEIWDSIISKYQPLFDIKKDFVASSIAKKTVDEIAQMEVPENIKQLSFIYNRLERIYPENYWAIISENNAGGFNLPETLDDAIKYAETIENIFKKILERDRDEANAERLFRGTVEIKAIQEIEKRINKWRISVTSDTILDKYITKILKKHPEPEEDAVLSQRARDYLYKSLFAYVFLEDSEAKTESARYIGSMLENFVARHYDEKNNVCDKSEIIEDIKQSVISNEIWMKQIVKKIASNLIVSPHSLSLFKGGIKIDEEISQKIVKIIFGAIVENKGGTIDYRKLEKKFIEEGILHNFESSRDEEAKNIRKNILNKLSSIILENTKKIEQSIYGNSKSSILNKVSGEPVVKTFEHFNTNPFIWCLSSKYIIKDILSRGTKPLTNDEISKLSSEVRPELLEDISTSVQKIFKRNYHVYEKIIKEKLSKENVYVAEDNNAPQILLDKRELEILSDEKLNIVIRKCDDITDSEGAFVYRLLDLIVAFEKKDETGIVTVTRKTVKHAISADSLKDKTPEEFDKKEWEQLTKEGVAVKHIFNPQHIANTLNRYRYAISSLDKLIDSGDRDFVDTVLEAVEGERGEIFYSSSYYSLIGKRRNTYSFTQGEARTLIKTATISDISEEDVKKEYSFEQMGINSNYEKRIKESLLGNFSSLLKDNFELRESNQINQASYYVSTGEKNNINTRVTIRAEKDEEENALNLYKELMTKVIDQFRNNLGEKFKNFKVKVYDLIKSKGKDVKNIEEFKITPHTITSGGIVSIKKEAEAFTHKIEDEYSQAISHIPIFMKYGNVSSPEDYSKVNNLATSLVRFMNFLVESHDSYINGEIDSKTYFIAMDNLAKKILDTTSKLFFLIGKTGLRLVPKFQGITINCTITAPSVKNIESGAQVKVNSDITITEKWCAVNPDGVAADTLSYLFASDVRAISLGASRSDMDTSIFILAEEVERKIKNSFVNEVNKRVRDYNNGTHLNVLKKYMGEEATVKSRYYKKYLIIANPLELFDYILRSNANSKEMLRNKIIFNKGIVEWNDGVESNARIAGFEDRVIKYLTEERNKWMDELLDEFFINSEKIEKSNYPLLRKNIELRWKAGLLSKFISDLVSKDAKENKKR